MFGWFNRAVTDACVERRQLRARHEIGQLPRRAGDALEHRAGADAVRAARNVPDSLNSVRNGTSYVV